MFRVIKLTDALGEIIYVNPDNICMLQTYEYENDYMKHSTMLILGKNLYVYVRENVEQIITLANERGGLVHD